MMISIFPGSRFSRLKLLFGTNRYFHTGLLNRIITSKESNYAIEIRNRSVKVVMASNFSEQEALKIKGYIETVFKNRSILVDSTDKIHWIDDIKNVSIYTLNE